MRAIILDDELNSAESLFILLRKHCPEVGILAVETDPEIAIQKIQDLKPELLFLDVELQTTNAFELLLALDHPFGVIFTTAYDQYAVKAFKVDTAIEYLLKPIDAIELVKAVERAKNRVKSFPVVAPTQATKVFLEKISVPTADGLIFLKLASIIRFKSNGSYTHIINDDKSTLMISKNLGAVEKMTEYSTFFRVHKSHHINLSHVVKYLKGEGGEVLLSNGDSIPIARDRREEFLKAMQNITS